MAFLISIGWNVIALAVDFSIDPRREEPSRMRVWRLERSRVFPALPDPFDVDPK